MGVGSRVSEQGVFVSNRKAVNEICNSYLRRRLNNWMVSQICHVIPRIFHQDMPVTREDEVVLLYALYCCDGSATKQRAINFILRNELLQPRPGDDDVLSSGEVRVENRIAWTRQNLKDMGQLSMPQIGTWNLTDTGRERLFRAAELFQTAREQSRAILDDLVWDRFSPTFLGRLRDLGAKPDTLDGPDAPVEPSH